MVQATCTPPEAFSGTVNFGAGNVTSAGSTDVFVTKLNASGAHQWTTTFGGTSNDLGYGVAVDSSGNVYTTGYFAGTVNFGGGNVVSAGNNDVFVTKLNASGQLIVAVAPGGGGTPAAPPAPCPWSTASSMPNRSWSVLQPVERLESAVDSGRDVV